MPFYGIARGLGNLGQDISSGLLQAREAKQKKAKALLDEAYEKAQTASMEQQTTFSVYELERQKKMDSRNIMLEGSLTNWIKSLPEGKEGKFANAEDKEILNGLVQTGSSDWPQTIKTIQQYIQARGVMDVAHAQKLIEQQGTSKKAYVAMEQNSMAVGMKSADNKLQFWGSEIEQGKTVQGQPIPPEVIEGWKNLKKGEKAAEAKVGRGEERRFRIKQRLTTQQREKILKDLFDAQQLFESMRDYAMRGEQGDAQADRALLSAHIAMTLRAAGIRPTQNLIHDAETARSLGDSLAVLATKWARGTTLSSAQRKQMLGLAISRFQIVKRVTREKLIAAGDNSNVDEIIQTEQQQQEAEPPAGADVGFVPE